MKRIFQLQRFSIFAAFFLAGLIVATLPVSQARWREVLGVVADADTIENLPSPTLIPTLTPIGSPSPLVPTNASNQTAIPEASATPPAIEPSPTDPAPVEATPTEIPPTAALPTEEPSVETSTEPAS
jgi:hypothetical protein